VSRPKVDTVNVVTMEHGREFAEGWFRESIDDACDDTGVLTWPGDDADDPSDDATERFHELTNDICRRVYDATKDQIAETFVRIANAVIDEERRRENEQIAPPRIETVRATVEHGETMLDAINEKLIDSGAFIDAFSETGIMRWPDDDEAAQAHYNAMAAEIRDQLFAETRASVVEAFVRIANDVTTRERRRR
jgi:hypothetical protein